MNPAELGIQAARLTGGPALAKPKTPLPKPKLPPAGKGPLKRVIDYNRAAYEKFPETRARMIKEVPYTSKVPPSRDSFRPQAKISGPFQSTAAQAHGVPPSSTSVAEQVQRYYRGAPGGFQQAVADAQKAMASRSGNPRNDPLASFGKWNKDDVYRDIPIEWGADMENAGQYRFKPSSWFGLVGPSEKVMMRVRSPYNTEYESPQTTLEHELTHALTYPGTFPRPQRSYVPLWRDRHGTMLRSEKFFGPSDEYLDYSTTPVELDPRLAEIKRTYTQATGQQVNTPEEAERAWNWYKKHPRYEDSVMDSFRSLDKRPELKGVLFRRMLELVRNNPSALGQAAARIA